jgi:tRNA-dihydrouridine synthase A
MDTILKSGVRLVTLHARKAWLKGLSPKQNRDVPPLWYERVYQFKEAFPEITVEINGGIKTHSDCHEHLKHVDAVMIGRAANDRPWWFHEFDEDLYKDSPPSQTRSEALSLYAEHVEKERVWGTPNRVLLHPLLNLFQGVRGAKPWRQLVSANKMDPDQQWAELHALAQGIESELGR